MDIFAASTLILDVIIVVLVIAFFLDKRKAKVVTTGNNVVVKPKDIGIDGGFGGVATLIQFSTKYCSRCPSTSRVLTNIADSIIGVSHIEVDLTNNIDIAKAFRVSQTPTILIVDGDGILRARK